MGIKRDPGRATQARSPGRRIHDPPGPQGPEDPPGTPHGTVIRGSRRDDDRLIHTVPTGFRKFRGGSRADCRMRALLFEGVFDLFPASLRLPLAWSRWPSASRDLSSVALPSCSLILPVPFSAAFFGLVPCTHRGCLLLIAVVPGASVQATRVERFVVTVRSSWMGSDGLPTTQPAWVRAPRFDALTQRGEIGGFLQGHGQDEFGVGGVAEQPGPRRADAPVAFGLFCYRLGQAQPCGTTIPTPQPVSLAAPPWSTSPSPPTTAPNSTPSPAKSSSEPSPNCAPKPGSATSPSTSPSTTSSPRPRLPPGRCTPADLAAGGDARAGGDHDLFRGNLRPPGAGQLPWADRLHTRAMRGTVMLSYVLPEQPGRQLDRLIKVRRMAIDDLWGGQPPRRPDARVRCRALTHGMDCRAAQCPAGAGLSAARPARSAAAVMLRSIPPNTTPWNGDMDLQYACPASPRGWKIARWL